MLYKEKKIALYFEVHKHAHKLCGQSVEFLIDKHGGAWRIHYALEG